MSEQTSSRRTVLKGIAASGIAAAASVIPATASAATGGSARGGTKPTIVFVHGAWADSSSWNDVISELQHKGFTAIAVPNELRSLAADSAYVASYLATLTGPVVLVGHSYGGSVISNAATGNPNVAALVFINAFAPDTGESALQLTNQMPGSALAPAGTDPTSVFKLVPFPGAQAGNVDLYLLESVFVESFASDVPAHKAAVMWAGQRPFTLGAGGEGSGEPAWRTIPSWYLVGTADKIIPPAEQLFMAQRANAHISEVRASHVSMVSHPKATVDIVLKAVRAVS